MQKSIITTSILAILMAGCSQQFYEVKTTKLPSGLQDCKIFENGKGEKIIRCPNSTTTFKSAKGASTTTSDGG